MDINPDRFAGSPFVIGALGAAVVAMDAPATYGELQAAQCAG